MITKIPAWKVSCSFKNEEEAKMVCDFIDKNCTSMVSKIKGNVLDGLCMEYKPSIRVHFPEFKDDGTVCERCGYGWHEHDFGVPHPLCPNKEKK